VSGSLVPMWKWFCSVPGLFHLDEGKRDLFGAQGGGALFQEEASLLKECSRGSQGACGE
jgi:hypothetical protein